MNKILENEWFWVRYPINGLVLDSRRRKKDECHIRVWFALCVRVFVTFGLHSSFFSSTLWVMLLCQRIIQYHLLFCFCILYIFQLDCFDICVCWRKRYVRIEVNSMKDNENRAEFIKKKKQKKEKNQMMMGKKSSESTPIIYFVFHCVEF